MRVSPFVAATLCAAAAACSGASPSPAPSTTAMPKPDLYALTADSLDRGPVDLAAWRGQVTLVVNVASECGLTPQYAGLQQLHHELSGRGFAVLGFPSNEFGGQEPGTAAQIRSFCSTKYGVDFPLFAKVVTKAAADQSPVYELLGTSTGSLPNWNFGKYVVGKDGQPIAYFGPRTPPDAPELRAAIERALQSP